MPLSRRDLFKLAGAAAGSIAIPGAIQALAPEKKVAHRPFGKTGRSVSIYAVGCAEIPSNEDTVAALSQLLDSGVNYIDTAPSYAGTRSETAIGLLMKTRRKEVFLATKTLERDADGAYAEIKRSLERLQTDHVDLLQCHAINDSSNLDKILSKGGAVQGIERAKKEGLVKHIGITGHTRPEVIIAALDRYPFDSILCPVSALDKHINDFAKECIPKANKLGIGVVGMKSLKGIERASGGKFEPEEFIRYALSLPITTLNLGLRLKSEVAPNLKTFTNFKKMTQAEMRRLEDEVKDLADVGHLWWKRR